MLNVYVVKLVSGCCGLTETVMLRAPKEKSISMSCVPFFKVIDNGALATLSAEENESKTGWSVGRSVVTVQELRSLIQL